MAIARAIVIEPPLVLMDEPLSNLDAKLRLEMRAEIRRIHRELGRTTIYVTHDQEEALSLADRIVVLQDGVVQQIGTPQEVYAPARRISTSRDFMGYRNVLELDVERERATASTLAGPDIALTGTRKQPLDGPAGRGRHPARGHRRWATAGGANRSPAASTTSSTAAAIRWSTSSPRRDGIGLHVRADRRGRRQGEHGARRTSPAERVLVYPRRHEPPRCRSATPAGLAPPRAVRRARCCWSCRRRRSCCCCSSTRSSTA